MVEGAESSADGVLEAAMLQAMHEADAAAAASLRPTVEEERERMEELREHVVAHGGNPKAGNEHGYVGCMRRNFERFLDKHGAAYGYDAEEGPTLQLARQFMEYCFSGAARWQTYSAVGRRGFYDGYFEVHLPYTLAQKVFPAMALPGWGGLEATELRAKAEPFKVALKAHWEALKTSRVEEDCGRSLKKEKWDDLSYFLAQDRCFAELESRPNRAVFRLAVMGFVRATCSRAGSMGKDWYDRKGLMLMWLGRTMRCVER